MWAICQQYHEGSMLLFHDMMMFVTLYYWHVELTFYNSDSLTEKNINPQLYSIIMWALCSRCRFHSLSLTRSGIEPAFFPTEAITLQYKLLVGSKSYPVWLNKDQFLYIYSLFNSSKWFWCRNIIALI